MHLESNLRPIENDCFETAGTLFGREQLDRLFTNPGAVVHQVHCLDKFIANRTGLPTK